MERSEISGVIPPEPNPERYELQDTGYLRPIIWFYSALILGFIFGLFSFVPLFLIDDLKRRKNRNFFIAGAAFGVLAEISAGIYAFNRVVPGLHSDSSLTEFSPEPEIGVKLD